MPFKLTMYFSLYRSAWSEAYLNQQSFSPNFVPTQASQLMAARAAMLGHNAALFAARISAFPANRQVTDVDQFTFAVTGNWTGNEQFGEQKSNIANVALMIRMQTNVGQKLIYAAGCPDGVISGDNLPPSNIEAGNVQGFTGAVLTFINTLVTGGWGCRSWKATVPVQALGLQSGTQVPPLIGVQLAAQQPWTVGQKVLLGGWRRVNPRSPGLTGVYTVVQVPPAGQAGPPFVYYLFGTQNVSPTNFKSVGTIGLLQYEVAPFLSGQMDRGVTRKRGGRSLLPLGRLQRSH
ncbi:MAG TPA: hypothetical protein VJR90_11350 [Gammaproteobacteria bacterium]|nr:hypothetical protein [Gammaproteobacteria bacterium]